MLLIAPTELKRIRKLSGLTQRELAHLANTSQVHISRIETGKQESTLNMIERISKALQLKPEKRKIHDDSAGRIVELEVYECFEIVGKNKNIYRLLKTKDDYIVVNTGKKDGKKDGKKEGINELGKI